MLGNSPILSRTPLKSAIFDSWYDPYTLITRVADKSKSASEKQLDSLTAALEYTSTEVHERVHWLQNHGTSFGVFLHHIRTSQQQTTLRFLPSLPEDQIKDLLKKRAAGIPIVPIEEGRPVFEEAKQNNEINLLRQIWFDHEWIYKTLFDSNVCETIGTPPASVFGEIFADVMLGLIDLDIEIENKHTIATTNQSAVRHWYNFSSNDIELVGMNGLQLTSKQLFEAPAIISEIKLFPSILTEMMSETKSNKALSKRFSRILESDYGIPIRWLQNVLGLSDKELPKILNTVNVLCFVALNPPVPPIVTAPPESSESWSWKEIYPPWRYHRLCEAVDKLGLIPDCRDHYKLKRWIGDLCKVAGLTNIIDFKFPLRTSNAKVPNFSNDSESYGNDTIGSIFHDYVHWVQTRAIG